jgi:PAS domain-containing protein
MHKHGAPPSPQARLRTSAEARLQNGTAPPSQAGPAGKQALSLLHDMAITPASASDAMKLLHELQVHQVELDLQQEQAEHERRELSATQARYFNLFYLAPFAYLTIDEAGVVVDANRLACDTLGSGRPDQGTGLLGLALMKLISPETRPALRDAFKRLHAGSACECLSVQALSPRHTGLAIRATTDGRLTLLSWMPAEPGCAQ